MRSWRGGGEDFLEDGALEVWSVGWQEKEGWSHDQDRG